MVAEVQPDLDGSPPWPARPELDLAVMSLQNCDRLISTIWNSLARIAGSEPVYVREKW